MKKIKWGKGKLIRHPRRAKGAQKLCFKDGELSGFSKMADDILATLGKDIGDTLVEAK